MTPEQEARIIIDEKLNQSGWIIQNVSQLNLSVQTLTSTSSPEAV